MIVCNPRKTKSHRKVALCFHENKIGQIGTIQANMLNCSNFGNKCGSGRFVACVSVNAKEFEQMQMGEYLWQDRLSPVCVNIVPIKLSSPFAK